MKKKDYNKYDFSSWVQVDERSPSGLVWIAPRAYLGNLSYSRVGKQAGNISSFNGRQEYYTVSLLGSSFFAHRVVYLLSNGVIDISKDIDHIDGNSLNNSSSNLREISPSMNARNTKKHNGKDLSAGVFLEEYLGRTGNPLSKIRAHYSLDGKVYSRSWSILERGYEKSLELAIQWRKEKIIELNKRGFGYTERHGT